LPGSFNGKRRGSIRSDVSQASLAVQTHARPMVGDDDRFGCQIDAARLDVPHVAIEHAYAMGINPQKRRLDEKLGPATGGGCLDPQSS
jgi:hypothetical protein